MSPKSITPEMAALSGPARSRLSACPSLCTTCARKAGRRGRTSRCTRASKSASSAFASSATQACTPGSSSSARCRSQATKCRACGWKNPRSPRARRAWNAATLRRRLTVSGAPWETGAPGSQLSSRSMWRVPSAAAIHSRSLPAFEAMTRGTGQIRRSALQVAQRGDLEVHRALAFPGRRNLEHETLSIRRRHAMVLVALALERRELPRQSPVLACTVHELLEWQLRGIEIEVRGAERPLLGDIHAERLHRGLERRGRRGQYTGSAGADCRWE